MAARNRFDFPFAASRFPRPEPAKPGRAAPRRLPYQRPEDPPRFSTILSDWHGEPLESKPGFRLVIGDDSLSLLAVVRKTPVTAPGARRGEFYEGLWEHDVAELFLRHPETSAYLELHVAPNGAWWSCGFEEVRVRSDITNEPLPGVETEGLEGVQHWEARITVPLASLPSFLAFDPARTRGNVCFCLGNEPRQNYATYVRPAAGKPDFHLPQTWLPLSRLRVQGSRSKTTS